MNVSMESLTKRWDGLKLQIALLEEKKAAIIQEIEDTQSLFHNYDQVLKDLRGEIELGPDWEAGWQRAGDQLAAERGEQKEDPPEDTKPAEPEPEPEPEPVPLPPETGPYTGQQLRYCLLDVLTKAKVPLGAKDILYLLMERGWKTGSKKPLGVVSSGLRDLKNAPGATSQVVLEKRKWRMVRRPAREQVEQPEKSGDVAEWAYLVLNREKKRVGNFDMKGKILAAGGELPKTNPLNAIHRALKDDKRFVIKAGQWALAEWYEEEQEAK